ncbi:8587_t:CDS:2 [Cetraspora pellucida]|uniref:8587_t:CDS:1 n=1 Tax=Cetraspora pellucida TaxID=1433469 RepID=A0ACA9L934_9GLOM|nr:8587_t:CDS:2 [Cetraspora pellucida]
MHASAIIEILQKKFSDKYVHEHNIYNLIQSIRCKKEEISDAGSLYFKFMKKQQVDPTFYIDIQFEGKNNYFARLCWMSSSQQQLWAFNLEDELDQQVITELPIGMFSEDMFDASVIELKQLIDNLD